MVAARALVPHGIPQPHISQTSWIDTLKTMPADLMSKTAVACLVARDAVFNLIELMDESSGMAYLTVRDCERELDKIEQDIDERLPAAITRVGEKKARELVACLRFITDLERIGDLIWWIAQRIQEVRPAFSTADTEAVRKMAELIISMLEEVHRGFTSGDPAVAHSVIAKDKDIDQLRRKVFSAHLGARKAEPARDSVEILFITQALERAGDHATNLAEELIHLYEGRSVRHVPKKMTER